MTRTEAGANNAFSTILVSGQEPVIANTSGSSFSLVAGTGVSLTTTPESDSVTVSTTPSFSSIAVPGQEPVIANTSGASFSLVAGDGITLTTTPESDAVTIDVSEAGISFSPTLADSGMYVEMPSLSLPPNYPSEPNPSLAYKPPTTWEGGQSKFGKWRHYFNAAEWGWGITYNAPIDPYSLFPWNAQPSSTQLRDTSSDTGASACVAMRFDVAEGTSGTNFWGIEWAPPSATKTAPDWVWGPSMYFYDGTKTGYSSGGLLRIASSAGRESVLALESNSTVSKKGYLTRVTVDGSWQLQNYDSFSIADSRMPVEGDGQTRIDVSKGFSKTVFTGTDVIALYGPVKVGDSPDGEKGSLTCVGGFGTNGFAPLDVDNLDYKLPATATDLATAIALVNKIDFILREYGLAKKA
jgi:hypothetical protein